MTWKVREFGIHTRFIELAGDVNSGMPDYVITKAAEVLNSTSKSIKGSKIMIIGLAYKKNIDDHRESPSIEILEKIEEAGASVSYSDPYIPEFTTPNTKSKFISTSINETELSACDLTVILTDHDSVNWEEVLTSSNLVLDTRGVYDVANPKVTRA